MPRDYQSGEEGSCRSGSAEEPEAGRSHLENVLREDREQRDRAAEQHGEEVERDRAEQHLRPPNQADAREDLAEIGGAVGHRLAAGTDSQRAAERDDREPDADDVDQLVADREQDAADRRARDHRELEPDRALRQRTQKDLLRDERRHERTPRRRTDRARDPLHEREHEERPNLARARPP